MANELITAIRAVHRGERHVPATLERALAAADAGSRRKESKPIKLLTAREREVLGFLALGHTNTEVASRLHVSPKTVETHRMHILEKLGLETRADLVRFAIEHKLMDS